MDPQPNEQLFLKELCNLLIKGDFHDSLAFFHFPCVVMNNNEKYIFNRELELKQWLMNYCRRLSLADGEELEFVVKKAVQMSPKVKFSQLYLNGLLVESEVNKIQLSFTLGTDENNALKIIVVVIDDA